MDRLFAFSILLIAAINSSLGGQLTFELPDNEKMCFFENIGRGEQATLMFQVLSGGNYDVDLELMGPNKQFLYRDSKKQYDSFTWTVNYGGIHKFCFSNEFSTFTHKIVYFHLQVGEEHPAVDKLTEQHHKFFTMLEVSMINTFVNLNNIIEHQTYLRLKEPQGRKFAEDLNEHVFYWSIGESIIVIFIGIGQILVLRSFFRNTHKTSIPTDSTKCHDDDEENNLDK